MIAATKAAGWRIFCSEYVLDELVSVLTEYRHFSQRFAERTRRHIARRCSIVAAKPSRHQVPQDLKDSPILVAALTAGCDYLITNDSHLLELDPYESLRIISMTEFFQVLLDAGLLQ
jgi:predicted nucleic acid-binding protein